MAKIKKRKRVLKHPPYLKFMAFMRENQITLRMVAQVIGSTVPTVSAKNNGYADYWMSEIDAICDEFGCSSEIFCAQKVSNVKQIDEYMRKEGTP